LSNCGDVLRAFATASTWKHSSVHQVNDLGYGKNAKDLDNPQPSPKDSKGSMDAVHRLNGNGFLFNRRSLRYSRSYHESGLADEDQFIPQH
jgi:hypothetical protein